MTKRVSAAHAKAHLADLVASVSSEGQHIVIERRGRPVAALVPVEDLQTLESPQAAPERGGGALVLTGAWREVGDARLDELMAEIYAARDRDEGRPVELDM